MSSRFIAYMPRNVVFETEQMVEKAKMTDDDPKI